MAVQLCLGEVRRDLSSSDTDRVVFHHARAKGSISASPLFLIPSP